MAKSTLPKPGPWLVKTRNITSRRNFESASRRATRRCMMDRQPWNKNRRRERRRVTTARTERGRWWWQREKGGRGGTRVTYGFSWKTRKKNKFRRINSIRGPAKLLPSPFCLIFFSSFRIYIYIRVDVFCINYPAFAAGGLSRRTAPFSIERKYLRATLVLFRAYFPAPLAFLLPILSFSFLLLFSLLLLIFPFFTFASSISYFDRGIVSKKGEAEGHLGKYIYIYI